MLSWNVQSFFLNQLIPFFAKSNNSKQAKHLKDLKNHGSNGTSIKLRSDDLAIFCAVINN